MTKRYAIYFAPPATSPLWQFGCRWLGRDAEQDCLLPRFSVPGFNREEIEKLTAPPRVYGFHGTLKPPFLLVKGNPELELHDALQSFAQGMRPFTLPLLQLDRIRGFFALHTTTRCEALHRLADSCVEQFDRFRRVSEESELRGRRIVGLTERQEALLEQYGYPYVFDQFHFHLTLTERLDNETAARLRPWLEFELGAVLTQPESVRELCLFVQDKAGDMFRIERRLAFGSA